MNIRELIGEDKISSFFDPKARHINPKLKINVDDGVYDDVHSKSRVVIVAEWVMYTMSDMWLAKGGPDDLPSEIVDPPFGYFPHYRQNR
jgi:hypothetical protein